MKKRIISVLAVALVVAMLSVVLVGCFAPKTVEDAVAKLKDKGYTCGGVGSGYGNISFSKTVDGELIAANATLFENKEDADALYEEKQNAAKAIDDAFKTKMADLKKQLAEAKSETVKGVVNGLIKDAETLYKKNKITVKKSGNWIAFGHEDAIKDLF